jgi:hypothetical protein
MTMTLVAALDSSLVPPICVRSATAGVMESYLSLVSTSG